MNSALTPILQAKGISKRFPGVVALDDVEFELGRGEVLAIIGENGAGKSTLMKILAGIQPADTGQIQFAGKPVHFESVEQARRNGIVLIHQELNLCENLDIGGNVFLGREPTKWGTIDFETIRDETQKALDTIGLDISAETLAGDLTIGQQQMVEIAKAVSTDSQVIIMDEPTSSLSQRETEKLYDIVNDLKNRGVSIIYISHRLGEVKALADRVVVLRDGKNAGELARDEIQHDAMVSLMVGRDLKGFYVRTPDAPGPVVLKVDRLRTTAFQHCELDFEIREGEIVGIAGLVGAGRTELLTTLFGITPAVSGNIEICRKPLKIDNCRTAIEHSIALVPEDRKAQGVILQMAIRENISLSRLDDDSRWSFIDRGKDQELAEELSQRLSIKTPSNEQQVKLLSGGNQQKVVIAKWLAIQPKLLLLDEPTRGVDVGAKREIYALMDELAKSGVAILFVSSDMEEVLGMSDRMLVMHEGKISGELSPDQFNEEAVMNLATGIPVFATPSNTQVDSK